jgi:preprotein translocase subunit SecG
MKITILLSFLFFVASLFFVQFVHSEDNKDGGCSIKIVKPCDEKENPDEKKDADSKKGRKKEGKSQK